MKFIKVFHPYWNESFYNKRWLQKFDKRDYQVDIYQDHFFDIKKEKKDLSKASEIIFVFPFWWYQTPWNLKKYIDEVTEYGHEIPNLTFSIYTFCGQKQDYFKTNMTVKEWLTPFIYSLEFLKAKFDKIVVEYGCVLKEK